MTALSVAFTRAFPGLTLDMAFQAPRGVTALYGPSGCGKTSTVHAIAGLLTPDTGRITLGNRVLFDARVNVPVPARRIGVVFQDTRLFPHLTVAGNIDYAARFAARRPAPGERDRVIDLLGLRDFLDRRPAALSGGERQRVAIARALLSRPDLLVLDEPLAALDPARKAAILPFLARLCAADGPPILYVSHDMAEIARLADHLVVIRDGSARLSAPVAEALSDARAAPLIGAEELGALWPATVTRHDADLTRLDTPAGRIAVPRLDTPGPRLRLRLRAQDVMIAREAPRRLSALSILPATVAALTPDGHRVLVTLTAGQARLVAALTPASVTALSLAPGAACQAIIKSVAALASS